MAQQRIKTPDIVVLGTHDRNLNEWRHSGVQLADPRMDRIMPVLERLGFETRFGGARGLFGRDKVWPDNPKRIWGRIIPFAYVRLPAGWRGARETPEAGLTRILDAAGRERVAVSEYYGDNMALRNNALYGAALTGTDPEFRVTLQDRFNISADGGVIALEDNITRQKITLMDKPAETIDTGRWRTAVQYGLYKALVRANPLSRAFARAAGPWHDGLALAPLWDRKEPVGPKDVERINKYIRKHMAATGRTPAQ